MKKIMALILVIILLIDLTSCHSYLDITEQKDYESFQDKRNIKVLYLSTKQHGTIYFSEEFPGKILNNEVAGPRHVLLKNFNPDSIIYIEYSTQIPIPKARYAIKNDIKYDVILLDNKMLICIASDTTRIPFSDIKQMHLKKSEQGKSALLVSGIAVCLAAIVYLIIINMTFDIGMDGW